MDEEAVSPVIAVILMVAITVVLAAVVFLVAGGFSDPDSESSGSMFGDTQESSDKWTITSGTDRAQQEYSFSANKAGARYAWNETATAASPMLTEAKIPMQGQTAWGAGAFLSVCADGVVPLTGLEVTFINHETNGLVTTAKFASVAPCT